MTKLSILGYGRFGAALGALAREAGVSVRSFDPNARVPDDLRVASLEELARFGDLVAVSVPIAAMGEAFEALRPHLLPSQIVFDVGSVKLVPAAAMQAIFGAEIPWVATHPLFGPASLARGEPLRVVVCTNPTHPPAARRVTGFFEQLGCLVVEQGADEHDKAMAFTHALAFFVAKGMLDAGAPTEALFVPASYQGIARTIETVRSDAGHLFEALHRENPHAEGARRRLLDALVRADRELTAPPSVAPEAPLSLAIPDLGDAAPALRETRDLIDDLDRDIVALLAQRAQLAKRAARAKALLGRQIRDAARESELLLSRRAWAAGLGLEPDALDEVFESILRFSRGVQARAAPGPDDASDPRAARK